MSAQRTNREQLSIGSFVESSSNGLGIGKVLQIDEWFVVVEYFDSPVAGGFVDRQVPTASTKLRTLQSQQRVYVEDAESGAWRVGRVRDYQSSDREYLVQFPNQTMELISEKRLKVRWSRPITDPTDHLAMGVNETAFWHSGRARFVRSLFDQRRACGGMTAILSSAIDIEPHQVAVVRRVMQDSIQRYLLADEVGLGKTIEAGILIRQYVLDEPGTHRVLVVVPHALRQQWREELRTRFFLEEQLDRSIHIVSLDEVDRLMQLGQDARMVVVDEAHHVAEGAASFAAPMAAAFRALAEITRPLDRRLLLLSATPALHNEKGFLAVLHLLDPTMYSLQDVDAFRGRIQQRQRIAEMLSALREDEPNLFLRQAVEDMATLAPDDTLLTETAQELLLHLDGDPPESDPERLRLIIQLRSHIGESWRLHRRILRTRRTRDLETLLPKRKGATAISWECPAFVRLDESLGEWRTAATQARRLQTNPEQFQQLVRLMAEAIACDPSVVPTLTTARMRERVDLSALALFDSERDALLETPLFEGEMELLDRLGHRAADIDISQRDMAVVQAVETEFKSSSMHSASIAVFSNYPATADRLFRILQKRFGSEQVFRHSGSSTAWTQALTGAKTRVIVCDRTAEEGLNLQRRRSVLIHADLPLSVNRIEQRMGRLDRYGGLEVRSVAMRCRSSETQVAWLRLLDEAFRIFHRSVASLQYFIEEEFSRTWSEYVEYGIEAIEDRIPPLSGPEGRVEREFRRVRGQAELDAFDLDPHEDVRFVSEILGTDFKAAVMREDTDAWVTGRLHLGCRGESGPKDPVVQFQFCRRDDTRSRSPFRDTLIARDDFTATFDGVFSLNIGEQPKDVQFESVPITFDRGTAKQRFARLARVGDPLIDGFARLLETDDRGIAFAIWRHVPEMQELDDPAELAFRFDFVVEADAAPAGPLYEHQHVGGHFAVRRRLDECFRPFAMTIWLDSQLQRIVAPLRVDLLAQSYSTERIGFGPTRYHDINLNLDRWPVVRRWWDADHWSSLCRRARKAAEESLREAVELNAACESSIMTNTQLFRRRCGALEIRESLAGASTADHLRREIDFEQRLAAAMEAGIRNPIVRLDSIGAVFLSRQNPFAGMPEPGPRGRGRFDD